MNTYLGQKGYTLLKSELSPKQVEKIISDLTIKPYVHGAPKNAQTQTFPAYRESGNKLYLPHYYGVSNFGPPTEYKVPEGDDMNVAFHGSLRDYQAPVVHQFIDHVKSAPVSGGLLELYCAWGKTSSALYIASHLKKKTLVIVHKEFLMNQWIERIQQFLPTARIGKIQGKTVDIDDKDIVICMLQSLSMKDYPASTFASFGFTILDEVHHISSCTFSQALFKLVTKYMLGLSATMNRKDGTTHVFKMFLGEVVHKAVRKDSHDVYVRSITYSTNDAEFNETVYDYRGNPQISTMISKICAFHRRTDFIADVLCDFMRKDNITKTDAAIMKSEMDAQMLCCHGCNRTHNYLMKSSCCGVVKYCMLCIENMSNPPTEEVEASVSSRNKKTKCPDCKKVLKYEQNYVPIPWIQPIEDLHVIILSHNLNILEYLYRKIVCKNLGSVGYYVGGMKESELKNTEKKQIVLATFAMAAEGLDIPTLNAEFLITPKTDIEQSVGRILRAKHATAKPIIYDIVDSHDVFKKQYLKRKRFYKKQNFKITEKSMAQYDGIWLEDESEASDSNVSDDDIDDDITTNDDGHKNNKNKNKPVIGQCLIQL
jgi:superfamily II DNA or RNA helicase